MIYEAVRGDTFPRTIIDFINDTDHHRDISYACLTAPAVVRCDLFVDNVIVETVFAGAGGSHSWWTAAGGKFFPPQQCPSGLAPGARLCVVVDGPCALRVDWCD